MNVADILRREDVCFESSATSKKQALGLLSKSLARAVEGVDEGKILDRLIARERLGSTALGDAVAMPHARVEGVEQCVGALLSLNEGVDFDADDGIPVKLLFGLLMPIDCSDNEVRQLKELLEHLRNPILQEQLRQSSTPDELYALLTDSLTAVYRRLRA